MGLGAFHFRKNKYEPKAQGFTDKEYLFSYLRDRVCSIFDGAGNL